MPLPMPLLALLSPQRAEWLRRSMDATGWSRWWASLSYVPMDTLASGLWVLTLLLFALLLNRSLRDGTIRPGTLFAVLFLIAGFEALYGICQVLVPSMGIEPEAGCAIGTFVNRNHYAAFLGMIWPLQLVWLLKPPDKDKRGPGLYLEKQIRSKAREKRMCFIFFTGVVLLGLVFSKSRGGIIGLAIGTTVVALLAGKRSRLMLGILAGCWTVILAYGSLIGFEDIINRFATVELDVPSRLKIWRSTLRIIYDHWLTGTGVGAYQPVVFLYQFFDTDLAQIGAAHNDYLQIASEWGLPLSLLTFSMVWGYWLLMANRAAMKSGAKESPAEIEERLIRIGALAGAASFLSHIWVEFNWQIPANQLYFVILLVLMSYRRGEGAGASSEDLKTRSWGAGVLNWKNSR